MTRKSLFPAAMAAALISLGQGAAAEPVPLPNPQIPGYTFPQDEATLMGWINNPTPANIHAIHLHGWGLWASLTTPSSQTEYGLPNVPVYLTWLSPAEIIALGNKPAANSAEAAAKSAPAARTLVLGPPHQFRRIPAPQQPENKLRNFSLAASAATPAQARDTSVFETVAYDPQAQAFAQANNLFSAAKLTSIYAAGNAAIPNFPVTAVTIKPVYKVVSKANMINGSIYVMPAWPGTPDASTVKQNVGFPEKLWPGCVYIDVKNTGPSKANGVDAKCTGPTAATTFGLGDFISYPVTSANMVQFKGLTGDNTLAVGDYLILMAMHVTSREITEWTWQTFFWTPNPAQAPLPSSKAAVAARPAQLKGPAAHYAMSIAYQMVAPNQPITGGKSVGQPVIGFNPYLEAGFPAGTFTPPPPVNVGITDLKTKKVWTGTLGIQSNCMTCHSLASFPVNGSKGLGYATDFYISRSDPMFKNNLQTDFLWSIPDNAK